MNGGGIKTYKNHATLLDPILYVVYFQREIVSIHSLAHFLDYLELNAYYILNIFLQHYITSTQIKDFFFYHNSYIDNDILYCALIYLVEFKSLWC